MKKFASQNDLDEKKISFEEIGNDLFAFTAEGDPNSGIIVGDDSVMVIDAQATPTLARQVIQKVRSVLINLYRTWFCRTIMLLECWVHLSIRQII